MAHDSLTGLRGRASLLGELAKAVGVGSGRRARVLVDIDDFGTINDSLGQEVGDQLLVELASRLSEVAPRRCTLARVDGDQFAFYLHEDGPKEAEALAEAVLARLESALQLRRGTGLGQRQHRSCAPGRPNYGGDLSTGRQPGPALCQAQRQVPF